jgi:hypothetical protein
MKTAEEILKPYVVIPFRRTEIVTKQDAILAMHKYSLEYKNEIKPVTQQMLEELEAVRRHGLIENEDHNTVATMVGEAIHAGRTLKNKYS